MGEKTQARTGTEFLPFPCCCHRKKMPMKAKMVAGVGAAGRRTVGAHDGDEAESVLQDGRRWARMMAMRPSCCDG